MVHASELETAETPQEPVETPVVSRTTTIEIGPGEAGTPTEAADHVTVDDSSKDDVVSIAAAPTITLAR